MQRWTRFRPTESQLLLAETGSQYVIYKLPQYQLLLACPVQAARLFSSQAQEQSARSLHGGALPDIVIKQLYNQILVVVISNTMDTNGNNKLGIFKYYFHSLIAIASTTLISST